jgi:tetratricopeptide (TPR) repeat protein
MAKRTEYVRKSVREILDDLQAGHQEAAYNGPEAALKYLRRTFESQGSLPNAVKAVAYDFMAEAQAQTGDWAGCVESVKLVLVYLADLETAFQHEYRRTLAGLTCFERGIQAHSELGDFHGALELCERAIALDLGAHYAAKRDSLEWAR